jgi:hypothetical protein
MASLRLRLRRWEFVDKYLRLRLEGKAQIAAEFDPQESHGQHWLSKKAEPARSGETANTIFSSIPRKFRSSVSVLDTYCHPLAEAIASAICLNHLRELAEMRSASSQAVGNGVACCLTLKIGEADSLFPAFSRVLFKHPNPRCCPRLPDAATNS